MRVPTVRTPAISLGIGLITARLASQSCGWAGAQFKFMINKWISDIGRWIKYRTTDRYDVVRLRDLRPGYYEPETRLLHAMMQILCDFVEVELAWHSYWRNPERSKKPKGRDREAGLAYLDWEVSLKFDMGVNPGDEHYGEPTPQAIDAAEVKAIYLWYRDVYQKRRESGDESGLDDAYSSRKSNPEEWTAACARHQELEEARHAEDAEYMKRLVDVRRSMWT